MLQSEVILYLTCMMLPFALASDELTAVTNDEPKLAKRGLGGLSFSYAATDIGSRSGTHIKTITVIKNVGHKKGTSLDIDPELHKDEDWGTIIRNNFDKYGKIPDIPEIVDLHTFLNPHKRPDDKYEPKEVDVREEIPIYETAPMENEAKMPEVEEVKPTESVQEMRSQEMQSQEMQNPEMQSEEKIEKNISDQVEVLETPQPIDSKAAELSAKAQSLRLGSQAANGKRSEAIREDKNENLGSKYDNYKTDTSNRNGQYIYPETYNYVYNSYQNNGASIPSPAGTTPSTLKNPYIAPNKNILTPAQLGFKQSAPIAITSSEAVTETPAPYVAPKIQKAYQVYKSSLTTGKPYAHQVTQSANRGNPQAGNNGPRFRGLRY